MYAHGADSDFATIPWDPNAGFEEDDAAPINPIPGVWTISTPGEYTLRFVHREDGASVDAFVFQLSNMPAPTGDGPPASALGGTVTFEPNQTSKTVTVSVSGDGNVEPDENFFLDLANPTNATIGDGQGEGTIINDDFISIDSLTVLEGNSGTTDAVFTVTLSQPFPSTVTVDYTTVDGTGIQGANAPADYTATSGTLTFAASEVSKTVTVPIIGDTDTELNEIFSVNLSNSTGGAGIGPGVGIATIQNDDGTLNTWTGAADGATWGNAGNWDQNRVPDTTDDLVIIPEVATTTIVNVVGNRTVKRLASEEAIRIYGGTFTLTESTSSVPSLDIGRPGFGAGNLTINGDGISATTVTQVSGAVSGSGDLMASGLYTWELGEMLGSGTTFANGGVSISGSSLKTINGRTLVTGGTSTMTGSGGVRVGFGAALRNTGTFNIQSDANINNLGGSGSVINDGTFSKTGGAGTTRINRPFTNNGTVEARSGELTFSSNLTNHNAGNNTLTGGTYKVSAIMSLSGNITTNAAAIELDGPAAMIQGSFGADALANLATNQASGSLTTLNGRNLSTPVFSNAGTVTVGGGTTFTVSGDYTQTGGTTTVEANGTLDPTGAANINGGILTGSGMVAANVNNGGIINPGGTLTVSGDFSQTAAGTLNLEMGATPSLVPQPGFDQLAITGTAAPGGTLNVNSIGGFVPNPGDEFQVVSFASRTGEFATENLNIGGGNLATTVYESTRVLIQIAAPSASVTGVVLNGGQANRSGIGSLVMQFSDTVTVSGPEALVLRNHTTGSAVSIAGATITGNGSNAITWDLSGVALPPGYYTATLPKSEGLAATHSTLFSVQPGDSTGDGAVGFADFGELAGNFNATGVPYISGDMDGDGTVGFGDFGILASNFNAGLVAPSQDTGDAAGSYPAAQHLIGSGLSLGANISGANDGVTFGTLQAGNSAATLTVNATIPAGSSAIVNAFIDFNNDGDWSDSGEQILADQALSNGNNSLTVVIPAGAAVGTAQARFRVSSIAGYGPGGLAVNGEVEDYPVTITASSRSAGRGIPGSALDFWTGTVADGTGATGKSGPALSSVKPIRTDVVDQAIDEVVAQSADVFDVFERDSTANEELVDSALQQADELLHDVL